MKIRRVNVLPVPLQADTLYFHPAVVSGKSFAAGAMNAGLVVTLTGATAEVVHSSVDPTTVFSWINSKIQEADIPGQVTAALAGFSPGSSTSFVENIFERDQIEVTSVMFCYVVDATDDPSVTSGSALYISKILPGNDWEWIKVAEYESLDISVPNEAIITLLSVVGGELHYNGAPIGNVAIVNNEW